MDSKNRGIYGILLASWVLISPPPVLIGHRHELCSIAVYAEEVVERLFHEGERRRIVEGPGDGVGLNSFLIEQGEITLHGTRDHRGRQFRTRCLSKFEHCSRLVHAFF